MVIKLVYTKLSEISNLLSNLVGYFSAALGGFTAMLLYWQKGII